MTENEFERLPGAYQEIIERMASAEAKDIQGPTGPKGHRGDDQYMNKAEFMAIFGRGKLAELCIDNAIVELIRYRETELTTYLARAIMCITDHENLINCWPALFLGGQTGTVGLEGRKNDAKQRG